MSINKESFRKMSYFKTDPERREEILLGSLWTGKGEPLPSVGRLYAGYSDILAPQSLLSRRLLCTTQLLPASPEDTRMGRILNHRIRQELLSDM